MEITLRRFRRPSLFPRCPSRAHFFSFFCRTYAPGWNSEFQIGGERPILENGSKTKRARRRLEIPRFRLARPAPAVELGFRSVNAPDPLPRKRVREIAGWWRVLEGALGGRARVRPMRSPSKGPPPPLFLRNGTLTSDRVRRNKSEMRATLFSPPGGTRRAGTRPGVAPFERFRRQDVIGRATTRPAPKTTPRVSPGQRRVAKLRATARYWKLGPYRSATATIRFSSSSFLYSRRDTYT